MSRRRCCAASSMKASPRPSRRGVRWRDPPRRARRPRAPAGQPRAQRAAGPARQAHLRRLGRGRPGPASPAGRSHAAVRVDPRGGWLDGGGLCPTPAAGHLDPRPGPERPAGLPGLDPGRRPGSAQRDRELAAPPGRGRRPGLGHAGQWGPLSGPGRLCPRPPGPGPTQPAERTASGSVRPAPPCTRAASHETGTRRRQDPASAAQLRVVDRVRQHRHRALGRQGGDGR
jgi:hypothetical protein